MAWHIEATSPQVLLWDEGHFPGPWGGAPGRIYTSTPCSRSYPSPYCDLSFKWGIYSFGGRGHEGTSVSQITALQH